jgi:hypothetical protein
MPDTKRVHCVIVCRDANGSPAFTSVAVLCTEAQFREGDHYDAARDWAIEQRYEGPWIVFDQDDGPEWLFEHFESPDAIAI